MYLKDLMNTMVRHNNDAVTSGYCNHFMEALRVNLQEFASTGIEGIIKCILSVHEFKSSVLKVVENTFMSMSSLHQNYELFEKSYVFIKLSSV